MSGSIGQVYFAYVMSPIVRHLQDPQVTALHSDASMTHINMSRKAHKFEVGDAQGSLAYGYYEPTPTPIPNLNGDVIGSHLVSNTTLQELTLLDNRFPDGVQGIVKGLESNQTLRVLRLPVSKPEEISALGEALKINTSLTRLKIKDDSSEKQRVGEIFESLKLNQGLVSISLFLKQDEEVAALGEALQVNSTLTHLMLDIKKLSLEWFFQFIQMSSTLPRDLKLKLDYFSSHNMTPEIYRRLLPLLEQNGSIVALGSSTYSTKCRGRERCQALLDTVLIRNKHNLAQKRIRLFEMLLPMLRMADPEPKT